jgi:hypothetical protein
MTQAVATRVPSLRRIQQAFRKPPAELTGLELLQIAGAVELTGVESYWRGLGDELLARLRHFEDAKRGDQAESGRRENAALLARAEARARARRADRRLAGG